MNHKQFEEHWNQKILVGALSSPRQLDCCLEHGFYHIPRRMLLCPPEDIWGVALYQSKRFYNSNAGVETWGKVSTRIEMPREMITEIPSTYNHRDLYIKFNVEQWHTLNPPVLSGYLAPRISALTNRFLLENSRHYVELCIETKEQYLAYRILRRAAVHSSKTGKPVKLPAKQGYTVLTADKTVGIYSPKGEYKQHSIREFYYKPNQFLAMLCAVIDIDENSAIDNYLSSLK